MVRGSRVVAAPDGRSWTVERRWLPRPPRWRGWGFRHSRRHRRGEPDAAPAAEGPAAEGPTAAGETGPARKRRWFDYIDIPVDSVTAALVVLAVILIALLAWFVLLPLLFLLVDAILVLVLAAAGVAARVLFRRPWMVVARADDPLQERVWDVVGFRASGRAVAGIAADLGRGLPVERIGPGSRP